MDSIAEIEKDSELVHHGRISVSCVRGLSHPTIAFLLFLCVAFFMVGSGLHSSGFDTRKGAQEETRLPHILCSTCVTHMWIS